MRKQLITFIIFCTSNLALFAQKDSIVTNFFEEGTVIVEVGLRFDYYQSLEKGEPGYADIYWQEIVSDTIINEKQYWGMLFKMWDCLDFNHCYETPFSGGFSVRLSDDGTLYYTPNDHVLYKFGKEFKVGGTIEYRSPYHKDMVSETITKIDTITFSNGYKAIVANDEIIYGLGHKKHPIFWYYEDYNPTSMHYYANGLFLCFYYRGEIILQNDELVEQLKNSISMTNEIQQIKSLNEAEYNRFPIYDLTGRRLDKVPEKGIYIQGGKLRFVQ